jgi:hypothetical protein
MSNNVTNRIFLTPVESILGKQPVTLYEKTPSFDTLALAFFKQISHNLSTDRPKWLLKDIHFHFPLNKSFCLPYYPSIKKGSREIIYSCYSIILNH